MKNSIFDLTLSKLQDKVNLIRSLEGIIPAKVTEENKSLAIEYLNSKSFKFFLDRYIESYLFLTGIILKFEIEPDSNLYRIDLNEIEEPFREFVEFNIKKHHTLIQKIEDDVIKINVEILNDLEKLYIAIINDPTIVYFSAASLKEKYNVSYSGAAHFKEILSEFHKLRKLFEKTDNPFNK